MYKKPKKNDKVYWMSFDNNYLTDTIPINKVPLMRVHEGTVVSSTSSIVTFVALVNEHFINNFEGVISNLKMLPKKKDDIQKAEMKMKLSYLYASMDDIKLKMIEIIINDFDYNK